VPTAQVPSFDGPDAVVKKIAELEAGNGEITGVSQIGDQVIITWKAKPKVGRPKMETRG